MDLDMWQQLKNSCASVMTYRTLSPDLVLRLQVSQKLQGRSPLNLEDWFRYFANKEAISKEIVGFSYKYFPLYCGLSMSQLKPGDRLEIDLNWTQICWFDWELDLYDDFLRQFGRDISITFDVSGVQTVADLMRCLDQQLRSTSVSAHPEF